MIHLEFGPVTDDECFAEHRVRHTPKELLRALEWAEGDGAELPRLGEV